MNYKDKNSNICSAVELPFYGQICVLVNKGYKIFDLRRGIALKVYRDDVDILTIKNEIECLLKGSLFDFAPYIKRWNIDERWYEEDYIGGSLERSNEPRNTQDMLTRFSEDVIPCLGKLTSQHSPVIENSADYVTNLKNTMEDISFWRSGIDESKMDTILGFIRSAVDRVRSEMKIPFYLVMTHGDFCPANMLNTKKGLKVIDWESTAYRSAMFDFYSYLFFRPLHQNLPLDKLILEIREALKLYVDKLNSIDPDISQN
ncbi:MAG: phosphotransferase, partial [Nitrospirota bacterium]